MNALVHMPSVKVIRLPPYTGVESRSIAVARLRLAHADTGADTREALSDAIASFHQHKPKRLLGRWQQGTRGRSKPRRPSPEAV